MLNEIKNIAKNESSFFIVEQKNDSYKISLSEDFKKSFPDEIASTNENFVYETKKIFGDKLKIKKQNNSIIIKESNMDFDVKLDKPQERVMNEKEVRDFFNYLIGLYGPKIKSQAKEIIGVLIDYFGMKGDNTVSHFDLGASKLSNILGMQTDDVKIDIGPYFQKKGMRIEEIKRIKGKKIKKKTITEVINEIMEKGDFDVENLKKKDELCPKVWDGDKLKPDVRKALLKNALAFIKFLEMEDVKFKDIILTGSLANYNWTEKSDLDVHLLLDFTNVGDDEEFLDDYFRTKKALWGERMPIKVKDHDVEMYVQNIHEPHTSTGVYSILKDKWLTKPIQEMVAIDINNVKQKAKHVANMIDEISEYEEGPEKIEILEKFMDKLRDYRKAGLEDGGEFSTENLVFKGLRHSGYLEKLANMKKQSLTKELSLENNSMYTGGTMKGNITE